MNVFGRKQIVIAGREAASFMSTKKGRESLRSREFWEPMREFYGASKMLTREDGEHQRLRGVMRDGFSREAVRGRYHELSATIDDSISSKWKTGSEAPVVEAFQYMIVQELGEILQELHL